MYNYILHFQWLIQQKKTIRKNKPYPIAKNSTLLLYVSFATESFN